MAVKRRIRTASQLRHELVPWPAGRHPRSVPSLSCICMYIRTRVGGSRERPSPFRSRPPPSKVDIYNIEKGWSSPAGTRSTGNPRAEGITVRLWDCETGAAACRQGRGRRRRSGLAQGCGPRVEVRTPRTRRVSPLTAAARAPRAAADRPRAGERHARVVPSKGMNSAAVRPAASQSPPPHE